MERIEFSCKGILEEKNAEALGLVRAVLSLFDNLQQMDHCISATRNGSGIESSFV